MSLARISTRQGAGISGRRCPDCELADGAQHPQAMCQRNAQIDQMLLGQLRQYIGFDLMLLEKGFELTEAKTAEPRSDFHGCRSLRSQPG